jgi:hypothetical protein
MRAQIRHALAAAAAGLLAASMAAAGPAGPVGPVTASGRTGHAGALPVAMRPARIAASTPARSVPRCTTATARAPRLVNVHTSMTRVPGAPFGIVATHDGRWDLAALGSFVGVFRNSRRP